MSLKKISNGKGGFIMAWINGDVEFVNPVERYKEIIINQSIDIERELIKTKIPSIFLGIFNDLFQKKFQQNADLFWEKFHIKIKDTNLSQNLISLLNSKSKKEQKKLLKRASLTLLELIGFIFYAFEREGYLFSNYYAEHHHKGLDEKKLPQFIHLKNDDTIHKTGETTLTNGELKQVINHRKVIVSKFIDRGKKWHCFFITYQSLKGEENWNNGQPHFHYISDKFGLSREKVLAELRSRHYKLNNLPHVSLLNYNTNT